jgi:hypothetical protein
MKILAENFTLNEGFCTPSISIIIFIIVIPIILAIILLADRMSIPYILDSEADYQRRLKKERPELVIDLSFYFIPSPERNRRGRPFVYDRLDPTGSNMSILFGTYSSATHNDKQGYIVGHTALREGDKIIMRTPSIKLGLFEREGGAVFSNGSAIEKGDINRSGTAVFVRKSQ